MVRGRSLAGSAHVLPEHRDLKVVVEVIVVAILIVSCATKRWDHHAIIIVAMHGVLVAGTNNVAPRPTSNGWLVKAAVEREVACIFGFSADCIQAIAAQPRQSTGEHPAFHGWYTHTHCSYPAELSNASDSLSLMIDRSRDNNSFEGKSGSSSFKDSR